MAEHPAFDGCAACNQPIAECRCKERFGTDPLDRASLERVRQRLDTSTLGRIAVDPQKDDILVRMVREAMRRTYDVDMMVAASNATDEACLKLYRMLKN